jgi:hypothetical protein
MQERSRLRHSALVVDELAARAMCGEAVGSVAELAVHVPAELQVVREDKIVERVQVALALI